MILGFDRIFSEFQKVTYAYAENRKLYSVCRKILSQNHWKRIGRPYTHSSRFRPRIKIMRVSKLNSNSSSRSRSKGVSKPKRSNTNQTKVTNKNMCAQGTKQKHKSN